jgi:Na+/melibiose symporter-like transporter
LAILGLLLGTGQTLFDTASQTIVPALVSREQSQLERANGRIDSVQVVGNNLAGPPAGGLLYSLVAWVPFVADAVSFLASSALAAAIRGQFTPGQEHATGHNPRRRRLRAEIAEGLRWLWAHGLLRTLAIMVGLMNLVSAAWGAPLVLFAQERLGLDGVGYGLLSTGLAVGAVLGGLVANQVSRLLGPGRALLATVTILGASTGMMGLLADAWLVGAMLAVLGFAGLVWNVITVSLRQAIVPDHLFGRVNSVYKLFAMGAIPLGALLALPLINTRAIEAARAAATTQ